MSTPILDRERSVPVAKPPSVIIKLLNASAWIIGGLLGAAAAGPWFPRFRLWVEALYTDWFVARLDEGAGAPSVVFLAIAAYYTAVAIHELGHVVAGKLAGYRFKAIRIGPIVFAVPFSFSTAPGLGAALSGHALISRETQEPTVWREVLLSLSGPLANLITAAVLLATPGMLPLYSGYLLMFSLVLGLAPMIPAETPGGYTDGARVAMHFGGDPRGARHLALMRLYRDLAAGIELNRSDPELFRIATSVRDATSDTAMAHILAFQGASMDGRWEDAASYLDTALEFSRHLPESMREALKSDVATFQARRRKRVDLAEQWLAEVPERATRPWNRLRPEAAILEAKGDVAGAIAKVAEVERAMQALPAGGARDVALGELRKWRAELDARVSGLAQDDPSRRPVETG